MSGMVVASIVAQPRIVGVSVDDWIEFGDITVNWSSNDPNATFPPPATEWLKETNETEWMKMTVTDVSSPNITFQILSHYKNGTEGSYGGYINIDTGDNTNGTFMAISANLQTNDTIYSSGPYSSWRINETISRTYPDGVRETNHLNLTYGPYSWNVSEMQYYYYYTMNFYWDRATGLLVEDYFEEINQTGEYITTWSELSRTTNSNVWVIPEFPVWSLTLLMLVVLTATIATIKQRLLKTPIH